MTCSVIFKLIAKSLTGHSDIRVGVRLSTSWITRESFEDHFNVRSDNVQFRNQKVTEFRLIVLSRFFRVIFRWMTEIWPNNKWAIIGSFLSNFFCTLPKRDWFAKTQFCIRCDFDRRSFFYDCLSWWLKNDSGVNGVLLTVDTPETGYNWPIE